MTTPAYPGTLPAPLIAGYEVDPIDQTVRTDMEAGAARVRRRTTVLQDKVQASWIFTNAQFTAFRTWFNDPNNGAGGAAWFTVNLMVGSGSLTSVTARFVGPFTAPMLDGFNWQVNAVLEVQGL